MIKRHYFYYATVDSRTEDAKGFCCHGVFSVNSLFNDSEKAYREARLKASRLLGVKGSEVIISKLNRI